MNFWKKLVSRANPPGASARGRENGDASATVSARVFMPSATPTMRQRGSRAFADALLDAADCGDVSAVRALLDEGADVHNEGTLIMAAQNGHDDVVQLLLDRAANPDLSTHNGVTALSQAAMNGHAKVVEALLAKGARVEARLADGATPLLLAAQNGHLWAVQALLDRGADVHARTSDGGTPLIQASHKRHNEIVRVLLTCGADVRAAQADGTTALHLAAKAGSSEIVIALLGCGANTNTKMSNGATALMLAAVEGHRDVAAALLAGGANPRIKLGNVTAQMMAQHEGHHELAQLLEPPLRGPAENLQRWKASGEPDAWLAQHGDGWRHDDWLQLLASLRRSDYWPMEEDGIGQHLETLWEKLKQLTE